MPKITAPTIAEHRERIQGMLVDAAERLLREGQALTAGAVTASAGIARNSIYRYVESIDDLRGMVLARYLPTWDAAVRAAVEAESDPGDRVVVWVRVNLEQAIGTGHGWLMEAGRDKAISRGTAAVADHAHSILRDSLASAWLGVVADVEAATNWAWLTLGVLQAALGHLDELDETRRDRLVEATVGAARALVNAARAALT